jgi:N-acetylglucosaminyl-diphospho-decaprenol L-rhamnosyltransferase
VTSVEPRLRISFVVVTWNSAPEVPQLLASLERCLTAGDELVVVDNASSDETWRLLEAWTGPRSLTRLEQNLGFGGANNIGVRRAANEAVVLLNPDVRLIDASIRRLAALALANGSLYGPELLNDDGSRQPSASALPAGWEAAIAAVLPGRLMPEPVRERCEPWRASRSIEVGWLTGACVAARRSTLLRLGPFDERIGLYGEDLDLGLRAREAGITSVFAPDVARVVHLGGRATARRFADGGVTASYESRRRVVRLRLGVWRERYDHATQLAFHGTRFAAKSLLRRQPRPEGAWLRAALGSARAR